MAEQQFGDIYARLDAYGALWLEGPNSKGDYYVWHFTECDFEGVREVSSGDEVVKILATAKALAPTGICDLVVGRVTITAEHVPAFAVWLQEKVDPIGTALAKVDISEFIKSGGRV